MKAASSQGNSSSLLLKVLCLHGSRQTKETFSNRVGSLRRKVRQYAELTFVDGPHELPLQEGDQVPTRTWWLYSGTEEEQRRTIGESFEFLKEYWKENGPFDGVFGFSMGGLMAAILCSHPLLFPGLKFAFISSGPYPSRPELFPWGNGKDKVPPSITSLHIMGEADNVVSIESSRSLAERFHNPQIFVHSQGHCLPSKKEAMNLYVEFFRKRSESLQHSANSSKPQDCCCSSEESAQEQRDEIEALEAIYPDTMDVLTVAPSGKGDKCAVLQFLLNIPESPLNGKVKLKVKYSADYPESVPKLELVHNLDGLQFPLPKQRNLLNAVQREIADQIGMPIVFSVITAAEEWMQQNVDLVVVENGVEENADEQETLGSEQKNIWDVDQVDEETENSMVEAASKEACAFVGDMLKSKPFESSASSGAGKGVKEITVGLIGKPSAGKSSFFNCVTKLQNEAKVAAHPFTTIEPNFGSGWWASYDTYDTNSSNSCRWGRTPDNRRFLPLKIKDVAGLVPGAYKGVGKGNQFLNDLVDCSVLIHILDASGSADRNGVATDDAASDPADDIQWIRQEVHRWIFNNIAAKYRSVIRAAKKNERAAEERLVALFSGYQGSTKRALATASTRAGLDLSKCDEFTRLELHRLVAHFISARFHILLALNKIDRLFEQNKLDNLELTKQVALGEGYEAVACSALLESFLLNLSKKGLLVYDLGSKEFKVKDKAGLAEFIAKNPACQARLDGALRFLEHFGTTGVLNCITAAVKQLRVLTVYPVSDLKTGASINPREKTATAYRDCLQAFPGTTIEDIFVALKKPQTIPEYRVDGEFIRAEVTSLKGAQTSVRQCGKDFVLDKDHCVVKILTNKKPIWQEKISSSSN